MLLQLGTRESTGIPDSKVHRANMGPIWGRQDPGGPHVGPMNFAIWDGIDPEIQNIPSEELIAGKLLTDHYESVVLWTALDHAFMKMKSPLLCYNISQLHYDNPEKNQTLFFFKLVDRGQGIFVCNLPIF